MEPVNSMLPLNRAKKDESSVALGDEEELLNAVFH